MTEIVCLDCGAPSVITVNVTGQTVGSCSEHFFDVMDGQVARLAEDRGIPLDVARKLTAKVVREALGKDGQTDGFGGPTDDGLGYG
jgi:hypothetical protein